MLEVAACLVFAYRLTGNDFIGKSEPGAAAGASSGKAIGEGNDQNSMQARDGVQLEARFLAALYRAEMCWQHCRIMIIAVPAFHERRACNVR